MNKNIGWVSVVILWGILYSMVNVRGPQEDFTALFFAHPIAIIVWLLIAVALFVLGRKAVNSTQEPSKSIWRGLYLILTIISNLLLMVLLYTYLTKLV